MIGNAHIDPVWLWPWQAGVDEALATLRSAADRCEEYPEFIFTRGEAWLFQQVERLDPELFKRIRKLVEKKQWNITGGQFLQPDCNLPTEMGLRRQIEHGQRYFKEKFGITPDVGYNVDSFGHAGSLPDIYAEYGYRGYCFQRPRPTQLPLPGQTFRWRGFSGAELTAFRIIPLYVTRSDDLWGQIQLAIENANPGLGHTMCFYGVGNHGGGPTKANIEYILENRDAFEGAELKFSSPDIFFDAVAKTKQTLPLYQGELQNCFPCCYSVMQDIKQTQMLEEYRLRQAQESIEAFSPKDKQPKFIQRLDNAWEDLLFTEFHDILAGTASRSTWPATRAMQGRARISSEEIICETTRLWARKNLANVNEQQLVLANPSDRAFKGWIEAEPFIDFDRWGSRQLYDENGHSIPFQRIQPDGNIRTLNRILFFQHIPPKSMRQLILRPAKNKNTAAKNTFTISPDMLDNGKIRLELSRNGIRQILIKGKQPQLSGRGIWLQLRRDTTDTWTMLNNSFCDKVSASFKGNGWVVEESGPLRASLRNEGWIGHSRVIWHIALCKGETRFASNFEVVFCEQNTLLQMGISCAQDLEQWQAGVPGGVATRPCNLTEMPIQGWLLAKAKSSNMAFVTADAYSARVNGKNILWTLLRSPEMAHSGALPEVHHGWRKFTDQGLHTFDFIVAPAFNGTLHNLQESLENKLMPPIVFDRYEGMNRPPLGK